MSNIQFPGNLYLLFVYVVSNKTLSSHEHELIMFTKCNNGWEHVLLPNVWSEGHPGWKERNRELMPKISDKNPVRTKLFSSFLVAEGGIVKLLYYMPQLSEQLPQWGPHNRG